MSTVTLPTLSAKDFASDQDVIHMARCSGKLIDLVPLRNRYSEKQCTTFSSLDKRRNQIRLWHAQKHDDLNRLPAFLHKLTFDDRLDNF